MGSHVDAKIANFIESYFNKYVTENVALWDYYVLNYEDCEFKDLTVYYHTWEGNDIVKEYKRHVIKIPYTEII